MIERARHAEPREPHVIEDEIEETRSSLEATVDELQQRLSSRVFIDRILSYTRSAGADFGTGLAETVRYNPVPTVLTGVGIAWLMASRNHRGNGDEAHDARPPGMRDRAHHARDQLRDGARSVRDSARSSADRVRDTSHRAAERLREGRERAGERFERAGASAMDLFEEQPLLVGALAVAVGATLGALLPPTDAEDRYLGRASERTRDRAADVAHDITEKTTERVSARVAGTSTSSAGTSSTRAETSGPTERPDSLRSSSPATPHP